MEGTEGWENVAMGVWLSDSECGNNSRQGSRAAGVGVEISSLAKRRLHEFLHPTNKQLLKPLLGEGRKGP